MKKATYLLLMLALLLPVAIPASAAPGTAIFAVGQGSGYPGSTGINIPISIDTGGLDVAAVNFNLTYDASKLVFQSISAGSSATQAGKSLESNAETAGVVKVVIYGLNQTAVGNGVLANAVFAIKGDAAAGTTSLDLVELTAAAPDASEAPSDKIAGSIEIQSNDSPFDDVPPDHPYYDDIVLLYDLGYIKGCGANPPLYCPDAYLTRAEMSVYVERGLNGADFDPQNPAQQVFIDVGSGHWAYDWTAAMYADGQTAGCSSDPLAFCPEDITSRAMMAVYYLRIKFGANYEPPAPAGIFSDANNDWSDKWIEAAYNENIMEPCSTDPLAFCPNDPDNRAKAAHYMVIAKGLE